MEKLVKQDLKKLIKEIDIEKERKILNHQPNYDNFDEIEKIIQNKVKTTETNVVIKNHYYNGDFDRRSIFKSNYRFSVKQASDKKGYALAILNIELEYCNDTNLTVQNLLAGFTAKIPFVLYEKQLQKFNKIIENQTREDAWEKLHVQARRVCHSIIYHLLTFQDSLLYLKRRRQISVCRLQGKTCQVYLNPPSSLSLSFRRLGRLGLRASN